MPEAKVSGTTWTVSFIKRPENTTDVVFTVYSDTQTHGHFSEWGGGGTERERIRRKPST